MKKMLFLLTLPLLFMACESGNNTSDNRQQQIDSAYFHQDTERFSCTVRASLPAERMNQAVGEWLDESLGGIYPGDPTDIQGIVDYYGMAMADTLKSMAEEAQEYMQEGQQLEYEARMEHAYETNLLVTYQLNTYIDLGGVHPFSTGSGATFRKKDGRRVSWDMIAGQYAYRFQEMVKDSLKLYFGVKTDDELAEMLIDVPVYNIPMPKTPPYITEDGILAVYQQYEIAPYAAGMPSVNFSRKDLEPIMTGWAKRLFK